MILLRHFTAAMFSIHALIGCCWHHAHQCEGRPAAEVGAVLAEHEGHFHHDEAAAETCRGGPCDDSQHEHTCQGDRCFFFRAKTVQLPPLAHCCASLGEIALPQVAPDYDERGYDVALQVGWRGGSLRPHLLHQVLLI